MKKKSIRKSKCLLWLLIIYSVTVLVRYLLAKITTSFPTVGIDEFLYYSLARSIATKGQLLFRGQSADYAYILYPLFLSPVYALFPDGSSFYRILQAWNTMLMSTSIFPIFFLSKELLQSEKKAFGATAAAMLLPDFILGELIFSEAILYPLFFTLMYCAYMYIAEEARHFILWAGFLGGLLYSTKPGAVAPAAVFILMVLAFSISQRKKQDAFYAIISLFIFLVTAGFFIAIAKFAFGYKGTLFSIYESQLSETVERNVGVFFKTLAMYLVYFVLSCGIVGFAYPALSYSIWDKQKKRFWLLIIASLLVSIIGSVFVVEQTNLKNNINLRYVAQFVPLFFLFCCMPIFPHKTKGKKHIISLSIILCFVVLCVFLFGCKMHKQVVNAYPIFSLSLINDMFISLEKEYIGSIFVLALCISAFTLIIRYYNTNKVQPICLAVMILSMLINGFAGYFVIRSNNNPALARDGKEVYKLTSNKPYIYLLSKEGIADLGIDIASKKNNSIIYTNDFINCLQRNEGVYVPYIPEQMRGMASVSETPDVDTLVVSYESMSCFQLSQYATAESPFDRNTIFVVHFTPNKRIVDSTLGNLSNRVLSVGKPGILLLYNDDYLQRPITISLDVESEIEQELIMNSTHELKNITVSAGRAWYDVSFDSAEDAFNFQTQIAPITVYAYKLSFPN